MSCTPVLAIHGGAGTIRQSHLSPDVERDYTLTLQTILNAGYDALQKGVPSLDAVTLCVAMFEDSPLFNAGRGAVYTSEATHELDAAVMDGATLAAGAVACVHGVKNPVQAARAIMEKSRHVLMTGEGAMRFLREHGAAFEPEEYFHTEQRYAQLLEARKKNAFGMVLDHDGADAASSASAQNSSQNAPLDEKTKMGTVGAVARDREGRLAAATSTGGLTNKLPGRVGDTPIIGAGCWADKTAAVSCTGTGEFFIRLAVGRDVAARMEYGKSTLSAACQTVLLNVAELGGTGGFIAVDREGNIELPFNTEGMYRGHVGLDGVAHIAIYGN